MHDAHWLSSLFLPSRGKSNICSRAAGGREQSIGDGSFDLREIFSSRSREFFEERERERGNRRAEIKLRVFVKQARWERRGDKTSMAKPPFNFGRMASELAEQWRGNYDGRGYSWAIVCGLGEAGKTRWEHIKAAIVGVILPQYRKKTRVSPQRTTYGFIFGPSSTAPLERIYIHRYLHRTLESSNIYPTPVLRSN